MKTFAASTLLFASSALAAAIVARDTPGATVALSNDQTGAYGGNVVVPINGVTYSIPDLFGKTGINQNGSILASSIQLTGGLANNPVCTVTAEAQDATLATINAQKTFAKFGDNPDMLTVVDLNAASITCTLQ